ncbi:hypothetical protein B0J11DRAFT_203363 [Dendryphion nanum]|uniref:Secreted protein n=1 Tax=Dendryphion nanum TaxID=256645 RepID=A0A9P9I7M1_9PLEO|nr:hypothetical protein B0J11DRAFT_203363 [Dendryphion nanum]
MVHHRRLVSYKTFFFAILLFVKVIMSGEHSTASAFSSLATDTTISPISLTGGHDLSTIALVMVSNLPQLALSYTSLQSADHCCCHCQRI